MKVWTPLSFLLLSVMAVQAQPTKATALPVRPEGVRALPEFKPRTGDARDQIVEDLNQFVAELNRGCDLAAQRFVADARIGYFGAGEWLNFWRARPDEAYLMGTQVEPKARILKLEKIQIDKIEGDDAQVTIFFPPVGTEPAEHEKLHLRRRGKTTDWRLASTQGIWGIMVGPIDKVFDKQGCCNEPIERIALFIKQQPGITPYIRAERSLQHLRQLGIATIGITQDYDDYFIFGPEYVQEALQPYTRDQQIFNIPATNEQYSFNARLAELSLERVKNPSETVLFYEGHDEQPVFRYNGKAAVGFADSHVKLVSPEEARKLRWAP